MASHYEHIIELSWCAPARPTVAVASTAATAEVNGVPKMSMSRSLNCDEQRWQLNWEVLVRQGVRHLGWQATSDREAFWRCLQIMCQGVAESSDSRQTDGQTDNDLSNKCALRYQPKGNQILEANAAELLQNSSSCGCLFIWSCCSSMRHALGFRHRNKTN